jgi:LysR family nitrogen assimilation transcriptional regulator
LRYFVTIVDAGSFSRAAQVARVAQPALSQQIADLED